jgi:uncharacterized membrane protein YeiH
MKRRVYIAISVVIVRGGIVRIMICVVRSMVMEIDIYTARSMIMETGVYCQYYCHGDSDLCSQ